MSLPVAFDRFGHAPGNRNVAGTVPDTGDNDMKNVTLLRPGVPNEAVLAPELPEVDEATRQLIVRLRVLLQQSLLRPREDLDKACMLISGDPNVTVERYAAAFFHGLEVHGRRGIRFFTPKAREISIDEMWMTRLLEAFQTRNDLNARYLLSLRVEPAGRRRLSFLANGLARALLPPMESETVE